MNSKLIQQPTLYVDFGSAHNRAKHPMQKLSNQESWYVIPYYTIACVSGLVVKNFALCKVVFTQWSYYLDLRVGKKGNKEIN
jgi:hypothetical protein